jgi:CheY-like chemotaxis protein
VRVPDRFVSSAERTRRDGRQALLPTILFADSDENYRAMARDALLEGRSPSDLRFATDGQDLLDYVLRRGRHLDPIASPRPALIVLDLELPRLPGIDAVRAIKSNPELRRIPVVALSSDDDLETVATAYDAGINTYLAKPVTFLALVKLMKVFTAYWLDTAVLPPEELA